MALNANGMAAITDHFGIIHNEIVQNKAIQIEQHQTQDKIPPSRLSGIIPSC